MTGFGVTVGGPTHHVNLDAREASVGGVPDLAPADLETIRVETTPSGPTASIRTPDGRWIRLHSGRDPVTEAERSVASLIAGGNPPLVIVIGLGLGYIIDALERRSPTTRVLAIEPLPAVARAMLARRPWQESLASGRLTLLVGPGYAGTGDAWRCLDGNVDAPVVVSPILQREFAEEVVRARALVGQLQFGAKANAEARRKFAPRYLLNTIRNIPVIAGSADVAALYNAFTGVPAVVVAAGPSLDRNIAELRRMRGRALVIAVDTALRPLLEAGIEPELVVGVDPSALNARHLRNLPDTRHTWLVAEGSLDPDAFEQFAGRTFIFSVSDHHPWPWLRSVGLGRERLRAWGSVLTSAFDLALKAGCDPIVFAGADLAYSAGQPYCRGTIYEHDWAARVAAGESLGDIWESLTAAGATMSVADVAGQSVRTAPLLLAFRDWLVEQSTIHADRQFVNATEGGVLMGGRIEQRALADALVEVGVRPWPGSPAVNATWLAGRKAHGGRIPELARTLAGLATVGDDEAPMAAWLIFAGTDVTVEAVHSALRHAEEGLGAADDPPVPSNRHTLIAGGAPERVWAIRSAILGEPVEASTAPIEDAKPAQSARRAARADAIRLLAALLQAPEPLVASEATGRRLASPSAPASRAYDWLPAAAGRIFDYECALAALLAQVPAPDDIDTFGVRVSVSGEAPGPLAAGTIQALGEQGSDTPARLDLVADLLSVMAASSAEPGGFIKSRDCRAMPLHVTAGLLRASAAAIHQAVETSMSFTDFEKNAAVATVTLGGRLESLVCAFDSDGVAAALTGALMRRPVRREQTGAAARWAGFSLAVSGQNLGHQDVAVTLLMPSQVDPASATGPSWLAQAWAGSPCGWLPPRVVNTPLFPCMIGNQLADGRALFAVVNQRHSLCLDAAGQWEADAAWPKPICGQVCWGAGTGAVAWHNADGSYVMWREHRDGRVFTDRIPFMACLAFPREDGSMWWTSLSGGLWSWTPGGSWNRLVDCPPVLGLQEDARGVWLQPSGDDSTFMSRPRLAHAFHWIPGAPSTQPVPLGPQGPCWSVATAGDWTAAGFPHSDRVLLTRRDGMELALTCPYPYTLVWAGSSLVVGTGKGTLLLFPDLLPSLNSLDD